MTATSVLIDPTTLHWDAHGLVTAIVQDATTAAILMVGHMNMESLRRTLAGPHVWFWSRSRQELWEKGATSGHFLDVVSVTADCDGDALLVRATPHGPTCHTGRPSCFHRPLTAPGFVAAEGATPEIQATGPDVLRAVAGVIAERQRTMPGGSYTTYLFREGVDKIAKKIGEEATEVVIGAKNVERGDTDGRDRLASEIADLFYHALVLARATALPEDAIWHALAQRRGSAVDTPPRAPKPPK
ncbi:MAG: bifunctional phosphoribosyl-AMP cyclohydrolase/phosphoribosyl-ATP diphosphatase HisIE [Thermomicrobia bacterium]|nr:bifunctional phosphoribosyl-AMP cyclohydrolase/phosphoribosyl-ATP diphosphatase HisIE [Thermomicrobia bacterium]